MSWVSSLYTIATTIAINAIVAADMERAFISPLSVVTSPPLSVEDTLQATKINREHKLITVEVALFSGENQKVS